jgi:hypothetical protein
VLQVERGKVKYLNPKNYKTAANMGFAAMLAEEKILIFLFANQLQSQQTNNYQLLYITSSTYFQSAAVMADEYKFPTSIKPWTL